MDDFENPTQFAVVAYVQSDGLRTTEIQDKATGETVCRMADYTENGTAVAEAIATILNPVWRNMKSFAEWMKTVE